MKRLAAIFAITLALIVSVARTLSAQQKPNILILWGDDIGYWNVSAYNQGMMGYKTPNIDRIAHEGALFTDWYGQQSCTAGRAAFITGQSPIRSGLTKGRSRLSEESTIQTKIRPSRSIALLRHSDRQYRSS